MTYYCVDLPKAVVHNAMVVVLAEQKSRDVSGDDVLCSTMQILLYIGIST